MSIKQGTTPDLAVWRINAEDPKSGVTKGELKRRVLWLLEAFHDADLAAVKIAGAHMEACAERDRYKAVVDAANSALPYLDDITDDHAPIGLQADMAHLKAGRLRAALDALNQKDS